MTAWSVMPAKGSHRGQPLDARLRGNDRTRGAP
jgi:hypothetical protein